jgi:lauroyl/myristoyl acyltransferase
MKNMRLQAFEQQKINISNYVDKKWITDDLKNFHLFSANISSFFNEVYDEQRHKELYKEMMSYRVLQGIDTHFYTMLDQVYDFQKEELDTTSPSIFVSFHIGSYRAILALLIKKNLDIVLLMDPKAYAFQNKDVLKQYENIKNLFQSSSNIVILPADKKDLALDILIKTRQGYSVLAFVDGNNGFGGSFKQDHSLKVDFMGKDIMVKQGLAKLSHTLSLNIVPIISHYDDLRQKWEFHSPIIPSKSNKAEDYAQETMQNLYKILEDEVRKNPMQWDGWLYIHKFLADKIEIEKREESYDAEKSYKISDKVGFFCLEDHYFLINKSNYKIFEIPQPVYSVLKTSLQENRLDNDDISKYDLYPLYREQILLAV